MDSAVTRGQVLLENATKKNGPCKAKDASASRNLKAVTPTLTNARENLRRRFTCTQQGCSRQRHQTASSNITVPCPPSAQIDTSARVPGECLVS